MSCTTDRPKSGWEISFSEVDMRWIKTPSRFYFCGTDYELIRKSMENAKEKITYMLAIIDLFDANHYADFFDEEWRFAWLTGGYAPIADREIAFALADRLFWALNPAAKTQREWCEWDSGYDVRVYDNKHSCIYKAHTRLPKEKPETSNNVRI